MLAAANAVMQMAIEKFGFEEKNIFIFGWSIGGFPATWLAANYPNVGGLILDATFDDILPLALIRVPVFPSLVEYAIKKHLDLPIGKQVFLLDLITICS